MSLHGEHKTITALLRWVLTLATAAIIGGFGFAWNVNARISTLEAEAGQGARYTTDEQREYARGVDRRLTRVEEAVSTLAPSIARIESTVVYMKERMDKK